ncbi:hypothetical protein [Vannielia litorea]|uniref:Uncharacterized protein n=1 Tax=Vannielia litorea TaxID=1217970 RepID=A0A1N6GEA4_9RHOB|nr:hypothetical protein [Vannielia litorea]SIO05807.1 hypothetical protein SAMN05444002_2412 [Vannielia litorea]
MTHPLTLAALFLASAALGLVCLKSNLLVPKLMALLFLFPYGLLMSVIVLTPAFVTPLLTGRKTAYRGWKPTLAAYFGVMAGVNSTFLWPGAA